MRSEWALFLLAACDPLRVAEDRARRDLEVGRASAGGVTLAVTDGLAAVRVAEPGRFVLWSQAPSLDVALDAEAGASLLLVVENAMPGADLAVASGSATIVAQGRPRPTEA